MKKLTNATLILALVLMCGGLCTVSASAAAIAENNGNPDSVEGCLDPRKELHRERLARVAQVLELSEEQQAQIRTIMEGRREQEKAVREELSGVRKGIRQAVEVGSNDEAELRTLAARQCELETELILLRARTKGDMLAVMTPEQQELAKKIEPLLEPPHPPGPRRGAGRGGERDGEGPGWGPGPEREP